MFAQVSTPCIIFSSVAPYAVITPPINAGTATEFAHTQCYPSSMPVPTTSALYASQMPPTPETSPSATTPVSTPSPQNCSVYASPTVYPCQPQIFAAAPVTQIVPSSMESSFDFSSSSHPSGIVGQNSNNSAQPSGDYKVYVGAETHPEAYCPILGLLLIKVEMTETVQVYHYDPESNHLLSHHCSTCTSSSTPSVSEEDLHPLYSVRVSNGSHVIFMKSLNSGKVRQYRMTVHGGFEQIENSNVQYKPKTVLPFLFTIYQGEDSQVVIVKNQVEKKKWTKEFYSKGGKAVIPPMPVRTLPILEFDERRPAYRIRYCQHSKKDIVHIKLNGVVKKFWFNGYVGRFVSFNCSLCRVRVTEEHLVPKYAAFQEGTSVIFFHNIESGDVEQYVYNSATMGLEQVNYPELEFDGEKEDLDEILVELHEECQLVIRRNVNGGLGFRKYLVLDGRRLGIPAYPVKTLKV